MLDLHCHTTASDGSYTPTEIVALARQVGLKAMAITDHDTVAGISEALEASKDNQVEVVPGVEFSAKLDGGVLHIVGLYVDHNERRFAQGLGRVMELRGRRNPRMSARLEEIGLPVTMEEASNFSGGTVLGRPHFAQAMVAKGYVSNVNEAFEKYLGKGGAAHVHKERLDPEECIRLIRGAGGVPILAHPDQTRREGNELDSLVSELREMGLAGIEVFCSPYKSHLTAEYTRLARKHDLVRSGGSDFHGAPKPAIRLGRGFGSLHVPDHLLEPIIERARAIRSRL